MTRNSGSLLGSLPLAGLTFLVLFANGDLASAQDREGLRWCNTYTPAADLIARVKGSKPVRSALEVDTRKIKIGKAVEANELGVRQALQWYTDVLFRPNAARDAQVIDFYRISAFDQESMKALIANISSYQGPEAPFLAVGASPFALETAGVDMTEGRELQSDIVFTPIKWNKESAGSLESAFPPDPDELNSKSAGELFLAKFVAYANAQGLGYAHSNSFNCNPDPEVMPVWADLDVSANLADQFFIATNVDLDERILDGIEVNRVLTRGALWPTVDE